MKVNIKKVAIWVGSGAVVAVSASAVVWNNSGFRAAERDVEAAYREIEALGIPLGADAFVASFTPKPEENNAPGLLTALVELEKFNKALTPKERSLATELAWSTKSPDASLENRLKVQEKYRPAMEEVRANIQKSRFVPQRSWSDPITLAFPEYSGLRLSAKLSCADAIVHGIQGNRGLSVQRLKEASHIGNLSGNSPVFIGAMVQSAISAIVASAIRECIINDPKGAATYGEAISATKRMPLGFYLRGDVYMSAAVCRNYSAKEVFAILYDSSSGNGVPPARFNNKDGLPSDPAMRAFLGYSLKEWLPVIRQVNPDGTFKDEEAFQRAFDQFNKNVNTTKDPVAGLHVVLVPELSMLPRSFVTIDATFDVTDAFAKVVEYHNQKGVYPGTLVEAGVTAIDQLSKDKKPLGYSVKNGEMRVWSVGWNGKDDGGLTSKEAFNLNPRPGENPSQDDGDITWVMPAERIAGKS